MAANAICFIRGGQSEEIKAAIEMTARVNERAQKIIELSRDEDSGPGGIDPRELESISDYSRSFMVNLCPQTVLEAKNNLAIVRGMLRSIMKKYSGYKTIQEREADSGCVVKKWTFTPVCPWGRKPWFGYGMVVSCPDIDVSATITKSVAHCYLSASQNRKNEQGW